MRHQARIDQIHNSLYALCTNYGFEVIEFDDIADGIAKVNSSVKEWLSSNNEE
jgi:hypothetical protein